MITRKIHHNIVDTCPIPLPDVFFFTLKKFTVGVSATSVIQNMAKTLVSQGAFSCVDWQVSIQAAAVIFRAARAAFFVRISPGEFLRGVSPEWGPFFNMISGMFRLSK